MSELVFLESKTQEPYTTSDVIAEMTGNNYRSVQRLIENHKEKLERFGRVCFQIAPFETKGGVQNKKVYLLNEQQATLLITFLRNNDVVVEFKTELVRQFFAMREELMKRKVASSYRKPIRRSMTDEIDKLPEKELKKYMFSLYTDLAYKTSIGKNARQIRKENNAPRKSNASVFLSADEIELVAEREEQIRVLIGLGFDYKQIKELLYQRKSNIE